MNVLIILMILSVVAILPFVWLRKPWALAIWGKAKLIAVLYALIILLSGVARLVINFDNFYG